MNALVPTLAELQNMTAFLVILAGVLGVLLLTWQLLDHYLGKLQARLEARDADAADEAYYRKSLDAAATIGSPWPPARKGGR